MENNIDYGLLYESIMQNVLDSDYLTLEDLSDFSMNDNTELVTEAYVGKTKECLQLEAEFPKLAPWPVIPFDRATQQMKILL